MACKIDIKKAFDTYVLGLLTPCVESFRFPEIFVVGLILFSRWRGFHFSATVMLRGISVVLREFDRVIRYLLCFLGWLKKF